MRLLPLYRGLSIDHDPDQLVRTLGGFGPVRGCQGTALILPALDRSQRRRMGVGIGRELERSRTVRHRWDIGMGERFVNVAGISKRDTARPWLFVASRRRASAIPGQRRSCLPAGRWAGWLGELPKEAPVSQPAIIEAELSLFGERLNRASFAFRHHLAGHPLFDIPRLIELCRRDRAPVAMGHCSRTGLARSERGRG